MLKQKREDIKSLDKEKDEFKIKCLRVEILNIINKIEEEGIYDLMDKMNKCNHVFVERVDLQTSKTNLKTMKALNYKCISRYCLKCGCTSVNINEFNYKDYHLNRYATSVVVSSIYQCDLCER